MIYLLAIFLPPLAVMIKKPLVLPLNLILCLFFWFPAIIHAILVVSSADADKRNKQVIKAIQERNN